MPNYVYVVETHGPNPILAYTSRVEPHVQPSFVNYETLHRVGVDNIQKMCDLRETYIPLPRSDWNETNKGT